MPDYTFNSEIFIENCNNRGIVGDTIGLGPFHQLIFQETLKAVVEEGAVYIIDVGYFDSHEAHKALMFEVHREMENNPDIGLREAFIYYGDSTKDDDAAMAFLIINGDPEAAENTGWAAFASSEEGFVLLATGTFEDRKVVLRGFNLENTQNGDVVAKAAIERVFRAYTTTIGLWAAGQFEEVDETPQKTTSVGE